MYVVKKDLDIEKFILLVDEKAEEVFADAQKTLLSYSKHFVKATILREEDNQATDQSIKDKYFKRRGDSDSIFSCHGLFKNWQGNLIDAQIDIDEKFFYVLEEGKIRKNSKIDDLTHIICYD